MFFQSSHRQIVANGKKHGPSPLLRLVIALNVLVMIIAVVYVAWGPGSETTASARAQDNSKVAAWDIPNLSAKSGSASQGQAAAQNAAQNTANTSSGTVSYAPVVAAAPALGGLVPTPTPAPTLGSMPLAPASDQMGGTCISGHIIDVYHAPRGAGFEITIRRDERGSTPTRKVADPNGYFQFDGLDGGTYIVELTVPEGWRPFTPATFNVTLSGEGDNCSQVRFKLEALACLEVHKLDQSGNPLGSMIGIPGWGMSASAGETVLQAETNGEGKAYFRNLIPGSWEVQEEARNGWMPADGYSDTTTLELLSPVNPGDCQPVVFVNKQVHTGCIAPKKINDRGEPIEGWKFMLRHKEGTQRTQEGISDANGVVYFTNLALGNWIVEEQLDPEQSKWWRSKGLKVQEIDLQDANNLCTQPVFTNEALGGIQGYKINHLEEGLMGWDITVTNDETGETFTTTTDIDGYFHFEGLSLGTWNVSETLEGRVGWEAVTPSSFQVDVVKPFEYVNVRFKNRTSKACLYVFKRDSYDNAGIPGWEISLKPAYGRETLTAITDGTGWARFEDLEPGDWVLGEEMQQGWAPDGLTSTNVTLEASGNCSTYTFYNHQTNRVPPEIVPFDPANPTPEAPGPVNDVCSQYYTVVRGDTLYGIGKIFGVTVQQLREVNQISNPNLIHPNDTLCIPKK